MGRKTLALLVTTVALAAPATAHADVVYCVNITDSSCEDSSPSSIQAALDLAAATSGSSDTVLVGMGIYPETPTYSADSPVKLIGEGSLVTTIVPPDTSGSATGLRVDGPVGTKVRALGVSLPNNDPALGDTGISILGETVANNVLVSGLGATNAAGVRLAPGTTLSNSEVSLPTVPDAPNDAVVSYDPGTATVLDSSLKASNGARTSGVNLKIRRSSIDAYVGASADSGSIDLSNSLIDLGSRDNATGLRAANFNDGTSPIAISATNVTIAGGDGGSIGALAEADSASSGEDATVTLNSTVIAGPATSLALHADNGETATVATSYSNYNPATIDDDDNGGAGTTTLTQLAPHNLAPGFAGPGDFRLSASSPLIDLGDPAVPALGERDRDGNPRSLDGDDDCVPRRDIGAYESTPALPTPQFDTGPGEGATTNANPSWGFSSSRACAPAFLCSLDGATATGCSSPLAPGPLSDGPHSLTLQALGEDSAPGDPVTRNFTVDGTPPETSIGTGPAGPTNDPRPSFSFSSSEPGSFKCRIDSGAFGACSGPGNSHRPGAALADGPHSFQVKAIDAVANQDPTAASRSFSVDTTPPQTEIIAGPSGPTADARPSFSFSSSELGSFECRIDSGAFGPCSGPGSSHQPASALPDGPHSFEVRAIDVVTNKDDSPALRSFTVDAATPETTITSGPKGKVKTRKKRVRVRFSFSSDDPGASFDCSLDGGAFLACISPSWYVLEPGAHHFRVRAADDVPNFDPTPAIRTLKIKRIAPKKKAKSRAGHRH